MARRQRLCPEITDPELRAFLDMVPSIRRFNTDAALAQPLTGETLTLPLPGREVKVCLHRATGANRPAIFEFHGGGAALGGRGFQAVRPGAALPLPGFHPDAL